MPPDLAELTNQDTEQYKESKQYTHMTKKELKANTSLSALEIDISLYHNWSEFFQKGARCDNIRRELHGISEI